MAKPTDELLETAANAANARATRRSLLKGATASAAGLGLAVAGGWFLRPAEAASDSIGEILSVARTAEQLAITFYTQGIRHRAQLGLTSDNVNYLRAAGDEEQLHEFFLRDNGGKALTSTFSFPHGDDTFEHLPTFVATLEQLEVAFIAAYLAAVKEFAAMGQPRLAQIAAQIMGIEAEHRVIGRDLGGLDPANNFGYEPALLAKVSDAVTVLADEGYLSPTSGNSYKYSTLGSNYPGVIHTTP